MRTLDHAVVRSEDFGAVSSSARRACLAAVRASDLVVFILGATYGTTNLDTGLSPTHEEFQEAQHAGRDVLAFVQEGVERDGDQVAFVREVRAWTGGVTTGRFRGPDDLRDAVTQALYRHALARTVGPVDGADLRMRLDAATGGGPRGIGSPTLHVALVGGPRQLVLSPAQLDDQILQRDLERDALYGDTAPLVRGEQTKTRVDGDALVITQEHGRVSIDTLGTISVVVAAQRPRDNRDWMPTLIDEDVQESIALSMRYAMAAMDKLDGNERLTDIAIAAVLRDLGHMGWRTRAERDRSPNAAPMNMRGAEVVSANLEPLTRKRPALRQQVDSISRDLTAILRGKAAG